MNDKAAQAEGRAYVGTTRLKHGTLHPRGYNMTRGGEGTLRNESDAMQPCLEV